VRKDTNARHFQNKNARKPSLVFWNAWALARPPACMHTHALFELVRRVCCNLLQFVQCVAVCCSEHTHERTWWAWSWGAWRSSRLWRLRQFPVQHWQQNSDPRRTEPILFCASFGSLWWSWWPVRSCAYWCASHRVRHACDFERCLPACWRLGKNNNYDTHTQTHPHTNKNQFFCSVRDLIFQHPWIARCHLRKGPIQIGLLPPKRRTFWNTAHGGSLAPPAPCAAAGDGQVQSTCRRAEQERERDHTSERIYHRPAGGLWRQNPWRQQRSTHAFWALVWKNLPAPPLHQHTH